MDFVPNVEWVGSIAGALTTAAYVPQVLKVYKEKNTKSISLGMYVLITAGIGTWCIYGLLIDSPSLVVTNAISCTMSLYILIMKIRLG